MEKGHPSADQLGATAGSGACQVSGPDDLPEALKTLRIQVEPGEWSAFPETSAPIGVRSEEEEDAEGGDSARV